jgi:tetratricopeptide (TPR) repeat protein
MFITLDKPLKYWGDKHVVLETAELTIESARHVSCRTRAEAEGEAQAMICGASWALQRIGRLDEARISAEKSLQLGEDIGWDRNTAYCEKCIGRLYRIMAEEEPDATRRTEYLRHSRGRLESAIARFSGSSEFGPEHPEVGDCHSLLGRTYLVDSKSEDAWSCVRRAARLLSPSDGKDYMDVKILEGELLESQDRDAAEGCYSEVLSYDFVGDSEKSEIAARAYLRRAINRAAMRKQQMAVCDFDKAEALWTSLGEPRNAARAAWERLRLEKAIPESGFRLLSKEPLPIGVEVIREHQRRLAEFAGRRTAKRVEPGQEYWIQLIKDARQRFAIENVEW